MNKQHIESGIGNASPDHEFAVADEDCPTCGNPKILRSCAVCNGEMARAEYKSKASSNTLSEQKLSSKIPTEIPKDATGRPRFGPGSDSWEESKKKLSKQ